MIYLKLFTVFLKIGLFSIGGGLSMLPLLQEQVMKLGWMTAEQFVDMIAISQSTPGPIGINMATYVGYKMGSFLGAVIATTGSVMPSIIIIVIIVHYFLKFNEEPIVRSAFYGLRPAVTGLIAAAGFQIAKASLFSMEKFSLNNKLTELFEFNVIILFIIILILSNKWEKHPVFFIAIAAIIGIVFKY